jgi:parallel beta-helix repeat protein
MSDVAWQLHAGFVRLMRWRLERPRRSASLLLLGAAGVAAGAVVLLGVALLGVGRPSAHISASTEPGELASGLPSPLNPSRGRVFYVSRTGSDSNPGMRKRPWRTIQTALKRLKQGQTALVRHGTYSEDLIMSRAGTASAPITLAAYPGETVVLHAASTSGDTYPIQIPGAYFRLQGFVIENGLGTSDANVYLSGSANHVELSGNEIRYGHDQGIFAERTTSDIQILGNRIHDNGWGHVSGQHQSHGIYIEGANDLIANNVIYGHPYGFGIQIYPANHDTIVVDNTIAFNALGGIVLGGSGGVSNITVRNNVLAYNSGYGIAPADTPPTTSVADHNVIFANGAGAIAPRLSGTDFRGGNSLRDPRFVSPAAANFRLLPESAALDQATPEYSEPVDFDGTSRPQGQAPDIGAFERT